MSQTVKPFAIRGGLRSGLRPLGYAEPPQPYAPSAAEEDYFPNPRTLN